MRHMNYIIWYVLAPLHLFDSLLRWYCCGAPVWLLRTFKGATRLTAAHLRTFQVSSEEPTQQTLHPDPFIKVSGKYRTSRFLLHLVIARAVCADSELSM